MRRDGGSKIIRECHSIITEKAGEGEKSINLKFVCMFLIVFVFVLYPDCVIILNALLYIPF